MNVLPPSSEPIYRSVTYAAALQGLPAAPATGRWLPILAQFAVALALAAGLAVTAALAGPRVEAHRRWLAATRPVVAQVVGVARELPSAGRPGLTVLSAEPAAGSGYVRLRLTEPHAAGARPVELFFPQEALVPPGAPPPAEGTAIRLRYVPGELATSRPAPWPALEWLAIAGPVTLAAGWVAVIVLAGWRATRLALASAR